MMAAVASVVAAVAVSVAGGWSVGAVHALAAPS